MGSKTSSLTNSVAQKKVRLVLPDIAQRLKIALSEIADVDLVIGIATGGTVLASLAAYELEKLLQLIWLNYRDENNTPRRDKPEIQKSFILESAQRVLLVDDVSVTGATFQIAKTLLPECKVTTLALKGGAEIVLFPEITHCILLPWRDF